MLCSKFILLLQNTNNTNNTNNTKQTNFIPQTNMIYKQL